MLKLVKAPHCLAPSSLFTARYVEYPPAKAWAYKNGKQEKQYDLLLKKHVGMICRVKYT